MKGRIRNALQALADRRRAWRRGRNFDAAKRQAGIPLRLPAPGPAGWIGAAGLAVAVGGAFLIAGHARKLSAASLDASGAAAAIFQPLMPGAAFIVSAAPGVSVQQQPNGAFLVAAGMKAAPAARVDLCRQAARQGGRLLPVRAGYHFGDVARWAARNESQPGAVALRNVLLAAPASSDLPRVTVTGNPGAASLQVGWDGKAGVRWISDASGGAVGTSGSGTVRRDGWLVWQQGALRIQRRASGACPDGELVLQLLRPERAATAAAQVFAFGPAGELLSASFKPGSYQVPATPVPTLEDQALFQSLQRRGLLRLGAGGLVELAPRDLAAWRASSPGARGMLHGAWSAVTLDAETRGLLARLYRMADGAFVREQVRVFNSERRLLAWRVRPLAAHGEWQASVGAAPAAVSAAMPLAASRLFAELPEGWAPWTRIAAWPQADGATTARITLALPRPALAGERIQLMLAGRALSVDGARMYSPPSGACTGRACPSRGAAQLLDLDLVAGAESITVHAAPLEMAALANPADQHYRHIRHEAGRLAWHSLRPGSTPARRQLPASIRLADRHGALLWSGGAPTAAAIDAGLAPLLGMRSDHPNSVAGMLARLPSPAGTPHEARLSLDLALQAASQRILDCIGMRNGSWDGSRCHGGQAAPAGRQAGIVLVDAASGDVLAAAGAGAGAVNATNWDEVRNFDRTNPARSPLRLPAFQHDGGAHRSPGSTFKVISALGLELAAQRDPRLDALLAGLPLHAINEMAALRGFAFQTNAAAYPVNTRRAHITNYRDQHLDRRAHDGRLGLAQALTYSLNTWFAWSGELADRSLFGKPEGGAPDLQPLEAGALDTVRPIAGMARRLGFERPWRLDGGLLPADYPWQQWDALQASAARIDPVHTRHELRQMAIGLRMQATPLQMALVAGAVGQGGVAAPRLLLALDDRAAAAPVLAPLGVRLDRIRAGMKGVVDTGTAAGAFSGPRMQLVKRGLSGKTGTAPTVAEGGRELSTVWFTGWLEPGSIPGETRRLAVAAFASHSDGTGGGHAAPMAAALLASLPQASR
ncbi:MAG: penicillin-binding transpeptidase domain-containing protein [Telluria sp.]